MKVLDCLHAAFIQYGENPSPCVKNTYQILFSLYFGSPGYLYGLLTRLHSQNLSTKTNLLEGLLTNFEQGKKRQSKKTLLVNSQRMNPFNFFPLFFSLLILTDSVSFAIFDKSAKSANSSPSWRLDDAQHSLLYQMGEINVFSIKRKKENDKN